MTMDKYSQDDDSLTLGLRDEEAQLMQRVQAHMNGGEKTAAEEADYRTTESRLQTVRAKITELDMARAKKEKV
jgi:hypothetical protein